MKVSIVIPVHSDADCLPLLIESLIPALETYDGTKDFEVVIADDNSCSNIRSLIDSLATADKRIIPVHETTGPGYANALRSGLHRVTGDVIIPVMPGMHEDPGDIHLLVAKIEEGYDIAYGSRFCKGGSANGYPRGRRIANRLFNDSVRLLFGTRHKDTTNSLKAYRKEVLDGIGIDSLEAVGPDINVEIPLRAHISGFQSAEVPVSWHECKGEKDDVKLYKEGLRYGLRLLKIFIIGNLVSLKDIYKAVMRGSPVYMILAMLIGLLILAGLFSIAGFAQILTILSQISPVYLLIACMTFLAASVIRTYRWNILIKAAGYRIHFDTLLKVNFFGWFINYILPAGLGDFMRVFALKTTEKVPLSIGISTIVVEGSIDMLGLATLTIVTLMMVSGNKDLYGLVWLSLFISFGMIVALLLIYRFDHVIYRISDRLKPLQKSIGSLKNGLRLMWKNPAAIAWCFLVTVIVWLTDISTIFFASRAVNIDLSLTLTLVSGVTTFIAQAIPITPAGIGIHESTIAGILYVFGVDISAGTSIALVDHFARGLITYILGIIATIHIGFGSRLYFVSNNTVTNADVSEGSPSLTGK